MEKRLGGRITFLSDTSGAILDAFGVRDPDGAPWYDKLLFGAREGDISFPTTLLVGRDGKIAWVFRSKTIDHRPTVEEVIRAS